MSEVIEQLKEHRSIEAIFADIELAEPKPIATSVAINVDEQKTLFLSGEQQNPEFISDKLQSYDFAERRNKLLALKAEIVSHPDLNPKHRPVYEAFINRHLQVLELMELANAHNLESDIDTKQALADQIKRLNSELYGDADIETFKGLVSEKHEALLKKELNEGAALIRDELMELLPEYEFGQSRFKPSADTVAYAQEIAESLYGGMLSHIDSDKESYSPEELKKVFEEIILDEFGESAEGWRVVLEKTTSINVVASERLIKIPFDRKPVSPTVLKGLVSHELGVHFLRSVMGAQTDLHPLRLGFAGYYDSEEGLGRLMEQAVKGKFEDAGIPYYLVTGLMSQGKDFRQTHEIMWRIKLLEKAKLDTETTNEMIAAVKEEAFKTVLRVARLTNGLTLNKDLSYYNGTILQWKYLEEIKGDYEKFIALFYGKIDPTIDGHERTAYEAKSLE